MGGKRPDQYNIDPREAGATDYKNLPQKGHGGSSLDDTIELDKQQYARSASDEEQGGIPAPGRHPAPSKYANAGTSEVEGEERAREARGNTDAGRDGVGA
jgi:hypothetical protein